MKNKEKRCQLRLGSDSLNRSDVIRKAAKIMLESGCAVNSQKLREIVNQANDSEIDLSWYSNELEMDSNQVRINLAMDPWNTDHSDKDSFVTDDKGNEFCRVKLRCGVNWSALGTQSAGTTLRYAKLLHVAAECVAQIEYACKAVWCCRATAEEIRNRKETKLHKHVMHVFTAAIPKRMRVNGVRHASVNMGSLPEAFEVSLANGAQILVGDKTYDVLVTATSCELNQVDLSIVRLT